jgi:ABC-type multidrug transport system fused ATPase/permease subunit
LESSAPLAQPCDTAWDFSKGDARADGMAMAVWLLLSDLVCIHGSEFSVTNLNPPTSIDDFKTLLRVTQDIPRTKLYLGLITTVLSSLLDGVGIGLMIPFLRILTNEAKGSLQLPSSVWTTGINFWLAHQSRGNLVTFFAIGLMLALALKSYFCYISQLLCDLYREEATSHLRERLYESYLQAPLSFYDQEELGRVSATLLIGTGNFSTMLSFFFSGFTSACTLLAYLLTLLVVSWKLTLLVTVLIGLVGFSLTSMLRNINRSAENVAVGFDQLGICTLDTLGGIRTVRSYGTEAFEMKKIKAILAKFVASANILNKKKQMIDPLTELATLGVAMFILVITYNLLIVRGLIGTSELFLFLLVLVKIIPVTKKINISRGFIQENGPSVMRLARVFELKKQKFPEGANIHFESLRAGIVLRNIYFSYNGRTDVLKDFSLEVPKGQTVALVGSSGAGKSTLAALLPRLYDVTSGAIEIDGIDLRDYEISSLRRRIATVSQDTYLFNVTIRENIAYGLPGTDDQQVIEAAQFANAHEFITQLPLGYDTLIGERGIQLSGGQRQRLSIARAILRNPDILILDEATSALDSQSEQLVQEALERLRQNRTVIVIAHRLSTVRNADSIVVLEKGKLIESGGHKQLLASQGAYWSFHNLQSLPS